MAGYLRPRRGKLATATSQNIVLKRGEVFFEVPTGGVGTGAGKIKMGDGTTAYSALPYFLEPTVIDVAASTIAFTEATSTSNSTLLNAIASGAQLKTIIGNVKKLLRNLDSSVTQLNNDLVKHTAYVESGVDLNTITQSGFYRLGSGHVNTPSNLGAPCDWSQLLVMHGGGDTITQIISDFSTSNLYTRSGNPSNTGGSGGWTGWVKVAVQSDIDKLTEFVKNGTEITDVTQITKGGMYYSNSNVSNAPKTDGSFCGYYASANGWIVTIFGIVPWGSVYYSTNSTSDGSTWTNSGWTEIANKADLSNKLNNANPTYNGVLSSTTLSEANRQVINATAENRMYVGNPNLVDLVLESNGRGLSINNIATVGSEQRFTGIHIGAESNQAYIYTGNDNKNINFRYTDSNGNTAYKNIDSVVTKQMFTVSGSDLILEWL